MTKTAAVVAFVNSVLLVVTAFGLELSQEQQAAIIGVVNALIVLVAALIDPRVPLGKRSD